MEDLISLKLVANVWAKALLESGALSQASVDSNVAETLPGFFCYWTICCLVSRLLSSSNQKPDG